MFSLGGARLRFVSAFLSALFALFLAGPLVPAQALQVARSPRELGTVVLRDLSILDGKIIFRVDSGGCTDAGSFKVRSSKEKGIVSVVIELDLEKDLGLTGTYTLSVANPALLKEGNGP